MSTAFSLAFGNVLLFPPLGVVDFKFGWIVDEINHYRCVFGIPMEGSEKFKALKKEWCDVLFKYKIETVKDVTNKIGIDPSNVGFENYIPIVGPMLLTKSWFCKIYDFLENCMNDIEIVALDILKANYRSSND